MRSKKLEGSGYEIAYVYDLHLWPPLHNQKLLTIVLFVIHLGIDLSLDTSSESVLQMYMHTVILFRTALKKMLQIHGILHKQPVLCSVLPFHYSEFVKENRPFSQRLFNI